MYSLTTLVPPSFKGAVRIKLPSSLGGESFRLKNRDDIDNFYGELAKISKELEDTLRVDNETLKAAKEIKDDVGEKIFLANIEGTKALQEELKIYLDLRQVLKPFENRIRSSTAIQDSARCRALGCIYQHRGDRKSKNPFKNRRGRQMFCKQHAGLRYKISKEDHERLKSNETLAVVAA